MNRLLKAFVIKSLKISKSVILFIQYPNFASLICKNFVLFECDCLASNKRSFNLEIVVSELSVYKYPKISI